MKKLFTMLLGITLLLVGCGKEVPQSGASQNEETSQGVNVNVTLTAGDTPVVGKDNNYTIEDIVKALNSSNGFELSFGDEANNTTIGVFKKDNIYYSEYNKYVGNTHNEGAVYNLGDTTYYYLGSNGVHRIEQYVEDKVFGSAFVSSSVSSWIPDSVDIIESVEYIDQERYNHSTYDVVFVKTKNIGIDSNMYVFINNKGCIEYIKANGLMINFKPLDNFEEPVWFATATPYKDTVHAFRIADTIFDIPSINESFTDEYINKNLK